MGSEAMVVWCVRRGGVGIAVTGRGAKGGGGAVEG